MKSSLITCNFSAKTESESILNEMTEYKICTLNYRNGNSDEIIITDQNKSFTCKLNIPHDFDSKLKLNVFIIKIPNTAVSNMYIKLQWSHECNVSASAVYTSSSYSQKVL